MFRGAEPFGHDGKMSRKETGEGEVGSVKLSSPHVSAYTLCACERSEGYELDMRSLRRGSGNGGFVSRRIWAASRRSRDVSLKRKWGL